MRNISFDIETSKTPNHYPWCSNSFLVSLGIADEDGNTKRWYFNHQDIEPQDIQKNIDESQEEFDNADRIIAHNIGFDLLWLRHIGIDFSKNLLFCTQVAEYLIRAQSGKGSLSLDKVCEHYGIPGKIDKTKLYWDNGYETDEIPLNILDEYLDQDCLACLSVFQHQVNLIREQHIEKVVAIQMQLANVLSEIKQNGMFFDMSVAKKYSKEYHANLDDVNRSLKEIFGWDLNLDSGDELSAALYGGTIKEEYIEECKDDSGELIRYKSGKKKGEVKTRRATRDIHIDGLGFQPLKNSECKKEGFYKTDKGTLSQLKAKTKKQKECIKLLEVQSELTKNLTTYFDGLQDKVYPDSRIHGSFNQTITATGRLSSSNPNCFSGDTEVLTNKGWIRFDRLTNKESVAQFDIDTDEISFAKPTKYFRHQTDEFLHITTDKQIDLMCTKNHRCLLENRKTSEKFFIEANNYKEDYKQIQAGYYKGGAVHERKSKLVLYAAFQADGYRKKQDCTVEFGFTKQRKVDRLKSALMAEDIPYKVRLNSGNTIFSISRVDVPEYFTKLFTVDYILSLDQESLSFFADELLLWDGCLYENRKGSGMYSSNDKNNADIAQLVYCLVGHRAKLRAYTAASGNISWQVDIIKRNYSMTTNRSIEVVKADSDAYCVSMPKGTLIVRHNGRIAITGNCQNFSRGSTSPVKEVFTPRYDGIMNADLKQAEWRVAAYMCQDDTMIQELWDGEDIHLNNALHIFGDAKYRTAAKSVSFGSIYGRSSYGFYNDPNMPKFSRKKWEGILEAFFSKYPKLVEWWDKNILQVNRTGTLTIPSGRIYKFNRYYNERTYSQEYSETQIKNYPVQGFATADIMPLCMNVIYSRVNKAKLKSKMICQVHDSIVWDYVDSELDELVDINLTVMNDLPRLVSEYFDLDFNVPLGGDAEIGPCYGKMAEYK